MSHLNVMKLATERRDNYKASVEKMRNEVAIMHDALKGAQQALNKEVVSLMAADNALEMLKEGFKDELQNEPEMVDSGRGTDS